MFGPKKTSFVVSLAFPISGTGLLTLAAFGAFSAVLRFCEHVMGKDAVALSAAMVVIFALMGAAYVARCLLAAAESSAEGYDLAPPLPNPLAVEELFAAFLGILCMAFFAFGPLLVVIVLGFQAPWMLYVAVGLGAAYLPMGVLGQAVRGDISGTLPVRVLPAIFVGLHRYFPAVVITAVAGFLVLAGRDGSLDRLPILMLWGIDVVVGWLLLSAVHRAGVVHREVTAVRSLLPAQSLTVTTRDSAVPHRPMSEIERALREHETENPSHSQ